MADKQAIQSIMSLPEEAFMAHEGVVQWAQAVLLARDRLDQDKAELAVGHLSSPENRRICHYRTQADATLFCEAAVLFVDHKKWAVELGLFGSPDFSEVDAFDTQATRDVRNMRVHVVSYFRGSGRNHERWIVETPEFQADASSMVMNEIGGRLDYVKFASAVERLMPVLLSDPIPYPPRP